MSGAIVWFTGVPGSGKSTLANALAGHVGRSRPVQVLDGDDVRRHLSKDLGFSKRDRNANVERIGYVARLLARHGVFVIVATISPYEDARQQVRQDASREGIPFALVFLDASLEALIKRDVKGHYRQAQAGQLTNFTGVSDPYERPSRPDLFVDTEHDEADTSAGHVIRGLSERGILPSSQRP